MQRQGEAVETVHAPLGFCSFERLIEEAQACIRADGSTAPWSAMATGWPPCAGWMTSANK